MAERVLSTRELNRALLARQMLLVRESVTALEAITRLVGLQAQATNAPYIGLWTRLQNFRRDDLGELLAQRQVARATLMRATLHLMTAADYLRFRPVLQPALTRSLRAFFARQMSHVDVEGIVAAARVYVEQAPRTFPELRALLATSFPGTGPEALAYVVRTHLPLAQVHPGGAWDFTGSPTHALAEAWLGQPLMTGDPDGALRELLLRYLAAFGPASVRDMQTWSGLIGLRVTVDTLRPELRVYEDEDGIEVFDLPDAPLPAYDTPAPVHFLPEFDNLILSHADRSRVMPDEYRTLVFLSAGRVRATFLVDGFVRGAWKVERLRGRHGPATLVIEPFAPLPDDTRAALIEEGDRLIRFIADEAASYTVHFADAIT